MTKLYHISEKYAIGLHGLFIVLQTRKYSIQLVARKIYKKSVQHQRQPIQRYSASSVLSVIRHFTVITVDTNGNYTTQIVKSIIGGTMLLPISAVLCLFI